MYVWVKPRPHTHTKCTLRFLLQYCISYKWGLLLSPIIYKCVVKMLCPVRRLITTLDCVLLKDSNQALVARDQFSSLSLCTTKTTSQYQMLVCHPAFYFSSFILPRDPKKDSGPTNLWTELSLASLSTVISSRSGMPRDPIQPAPQCAG